MSRGQKVAALIALAAAWGAAKGLRHGKKLRGHPGVGDLLDPGQVATRAGSGPLVEELIFRGGLQGMLGMHPAIAASAFGLAHYKPPHDPKCPVCVSQAAQAGLPRVLDATLGGVLYGVAFGLGGIPASWAAHAAHNAGGLVGTALGARRPV